VGGDERAMALEAWLDQLGVYPPGWLGSAGGLLFLAVNISIPSLLLRKILSLLSYIFSDGSFPSRVYSTALDLIPFLSSRQPTIRIF
jgi:hypothetical protein